MYHNTLITPIIDAEYEPRPHQPIAEAIDFSLPPTKLAHAIEQTVHESLEWETNLWPKDGKIRADQLTNCGGFAVVTSELLDIGNIPNYVAFANGHFLNIAEIGNDNNSQLQLVESGAPQFGQQLAPLVTRGPDDIAKTVAHQGSAAIRLNTDMLIRNAGYDPDKLSSDLRYRWLYYIKGKTLHYGSNVEQFAENPEWARANRYSCIMQVYPGEVGRKLIPTYGAFLLAARGHQTDEALASLAEISGNIPELDARAEHGEIKTLIADLAEQQRVEDVITAAFDYCSSFRVSQDPRLKGVEAGLYYEAAMLTGDEAIAGLAIKAYHEAMERARYKSTTYSGKLGKLAIQFGSAA